jgi:hypothetical protein
MKVIRNGEVKEVKRVRRTTNKQQGDLYIGRCYLCEQECLCEDLDNGCTRHHPLTEEIRNLLRAE